MRTTRRKKELSFLLWGIPGFTSLAMFAIAPFVDDPALWSGGGIFGVLLCGVGHALTCEAIERRRRD